MALEGKRILSQRTCTTCVRQCWSDQERPYLLILYDHYRRGSRDDRITEKYFGIFYDLQHFENHVAYLGSSVDFNWHNGKGESTALSLFS